jgi:hypothetical protein
MTDEERDLESVGRELREMMAETRHREMEAREIEERIHFILKTTGGFPVICSSRAVLAWCRCGAHVYECRTMDGPIVVVNENGTRHVCGKEEWCCYEKV